jgi:hypothetical protein
VYKDIVAKHKKRLARGAFGMVVSIVVMIVIVDQMKLRGRYLPAVVLLGGGSLPR